MFGTGWNNGGRGSWSSLGPGGMEKPQPPPVTRPMVPPPGGGMTPPGKPTMRPPGNRPPRRPGKPVPGPGVIPVPMPRDPRPGMSPQIPPPTAGPTESMVPVPQAPAPPPGMPQPSMPYIPPPGATPGTAVGARIHHDMGAGANYGETRMNPAGQKEMWANLGGGGQYGWVPWDQRMQGTADMFNRYGSNWYSGSGATSMHTADIAQILREQLGREPTPIEVNDVYYGVNRGVPGVSYNS